MPHVSPQVVPLTECGEEENKKCVDLVKSLIAEPDPINQEMAQRNVLLGLRRTIRTDDDLEARAVREASTLKMALRLRYGT